MEISVEDSQKAKNPSPTRSSYTTFEDILKGVYIFPQRYLLIHVHYCSIPNSYKLGKPRCPPAEEQIVKTW